jgi:hypothetical protein
MKPLVYIFGPIIDMEKFGAFTPMVFKVSNILHHLHEGENEEIGTQPLAKPESVGWPPSGMGSAAGTESVGSSPSDSGPNVMPMNHSEEALITEGETLSKQRKQPPVDDASEPRRTKRQMVRHNYQQMI